MVVIESSGTHDDGESPESLHEMAQIHQRLLRAKLETARRDRIQNILKQAADEQSREAKRAERIQTRDAKKSAQVTALLNKHVRDNPLRKTGVRKIKKSRPKTLRPNKVTPKQSDGTSTTTTAATVTEDDATTISTDTVTVEKQQPELQEPPPSQELPSTTTESTLSTLLTSMASIATLQPRAAVSRTEVADLVNQAQILGYSKSWFQAVFIALQTKSKPPDDSTNDTSGDTKISSEDPPIAPSQRVGRRKSLVSSIVSGGLSPEKVQRQLMEFLSHAAPHVGKKQRSSLKSTSGAYPSSSRKSVGRSSYQANSSRRSSGRAADSEYENTTGRASQRSSLASVEGGESMTTTTTRRRGKNVSPTGRHSINRRRRSSGKSSDELPAVRVVEKQDTETQTTKVETQSTFTMTEPITTSTRSCGCVIS